MISYIFTIIGGITLFLFGLNVFKQLLFNLTNENIKLFISRFTNTNLKAFLLGIVSTAIMQSSSGITAISIVLLSTNIINLKTTVLIMLGSNIGTCLTPFIFTFDIGNYSLIFIIIGYILSSFKFNKIKILGNIIISLGLVFLGLNFLDLGLNNLSTSDSFINLFKLTNSSFFSLIISLILTSLLQSSSAVIAIAQSLYHGKIISLTNACFYMLGANIGTTISSYTYALSLNNNAKIAVKINILFNIFGTIIFIVFLKPFILFLEKIENLFNLSKQLTVAYSHLIFNIISTIITFAFFNFLFTFSLTKIFKVDTNLKMC